MTAGKQIRSPITRSAVAEMTDALGQEWIKAVVDIGRGAMAVGGEMHSDDEALLLRSGSRQRDLWGINLYPRRRGREWIEFDSLINLRPRDGNRSRGVDDPDLRARIRRVVDSMITSGHP